MQRIAVYMVVMVAAIGSVGCSTHRHIVHSPGWDYVGSYKPVYLRSLAQLPEPIRVRVVTHLRARSGDPFYQRLEFTGGRRVDLEQLHRKEPNLMDLREEVPAYDLYFTFRMPEVGLNTYTAHIQLRQDGTVLREIDLPDYAANPDKLDFTPLASARQTALAQGLDPKRISEAISYDPETDSLVWHIYEVARDRNWEGTLRGITIYVHSGQVAKTYEGELTRWH